MFHINSILIWTNEELSYCNIFHNNWIYFHREHHIHGKIFITDFLWADLKKSKIFYVYSNLFGVCMWIEIFFNFNLIKFFSSEWRNYKINMNHIQFWTWILSFCSHFRNNFTENEREEMNLQWKITVPSAWIRCANLLQTDKSER